MTIVGGGGGDGVMLILFIFVSVLRCLYSISPRVSVAWYVGCLLICRDDSSNELIHGYCFQSDGFRRSKKFVLSRFAECWTHSVMEENTKEPLGLYIVGILVQLDKSIYNIL